MSRKVTIYPVLGYLLVVTGVFALAGCTGEQDQTVPDLAIAYVKRPIPIVPASNPPQMVDPDVRSPAAFNSGGDVYVRSSASPSASEKNITSCLTRADVVANPNDVDGDVKDLDTSYDGTKLIFSLFAPHNPNDNADTTTWDIYEYDVIAGGCPTRLITDDFEAEKGDDLGPTYLPDSRIVFTSSRQDLVGAIQLDEGNVQFPPQDENQNSDSLVLHVMSASGTNIRQISFNQSHDLDPSVLSSGEIVFSRWDNMGTSNAINLFKVRPDGTELKALYGVHAHDVGTGGSVVQFLAPWELDDGRILGMIKPFSGSAGGGAPVLINVAQYADNNQPIWPYQGAGLTGNGQINAVAIGVTTDASISPAGRFRSVYPIRDSSNRALVSWTQCRLQPVDAMGLPSGQPIPCPATIPTGAVEALPIYGIYVYDLGRNTQLPVVIPQEGVIFDEPVVVAPRPAPTILFDKAPVAGFGLDPTLYTENVGLLHIRSVYDFDREDDGKFNDLNNSATINPAIECPGVPKGCLDIMANPERTTADERPARFLRIIKGSYIPEGIAASAFGVSTQQGMRELLGYAPIEPDGSVLVKVPANIPFAISVVDRDGRRVMDYYGRATGARHQNWLQVKTGQVLQCNGCHDHNPIAPNEVMPHGYTDVSSVVLNTGASTSGMPFPGTDPSVLAEMNDTMAMTRIRTACGQDPDGPFGLNVDEASCLTLNPDINLRFTDVWTDPAASPTPDLDILYSDLDTPSPDNAESAFCQQATWEGNCRIIINYKDHISPLWSFPRVDATMANATCTLCHNTQDDMGVTQVPVAQLDLHDVDGGGNDVTRQDEADRLRSYQELLVQDNRKWSLVGGVLVFETVFVQDVDADGNLVFEADINGDLTIPVGQDVPVPAEEGPSMSIAGARASYGDDANKLFFIRFFESGLTDVTFDHSGLLTPAEIRLLSEWLDMGAQYSNNP